MDISYASSLDQVSAGVVGVGTRFGLIWSEAEQTWLESLGQGWVDLIKREKFEGKPGQTVAFQTGQSTPHTVIFLGLGENPGPEQYRQAAGILGRSTRREQAVATSLGAQGEGSLPGFMGEDGRGITQAVVEGFLLGQYVFTAYKSDPVPTLTESLVLVGAVDRHEVDVAQINAQATSFARDWVNTPAQDKSPEVIAQTVEEMAEPLGLRLVVHDRPALEEGGFGGLLGVAAGSDRPPRLLEVWYEPDDPQVFAVLVGKGITFDSGGLSIKPASGMETMKTDMSGAAAVLGAMQVIARRGIKAKVLGLTPLTDNMPGPLATKPGDVLTTRNGKTIEVLNTDAEGRLVLADALALGVEQEPDVIIDAATLTGACMVALGQKIAGVMGNNHDLVERIIAVGEGLGERFWPLPLPEDYRKQVESPVADMKNIGGRYGGTLTAGLILSEFVGEVPWAHLDIAGPARWGEDEHYQSKGGSGFGVRTLAALVEDLAREGLPTAQGELF